MRRQTANAAARLKNWRRSRERSSLDSKNQQQERLFKAGQRWVAQKDVCLMAGGKVHHVLNAADRNYGAMKKLADDLNKRGVEPTDKVKLRLDGVNPKPPKNHPSLF